MFDVNNRSNPLANSVDSFSQISKLDKARKRTSRWDSDSDLTNEPKTPRHDSFEPKTPRHDSFEPKTPRRDAIEPKTPRHDSYEPKTPRHDSFEPKTPRHDSFEPKTPRLVNLYSDEDITVSPTINSQHRDQIYDKFELTGGDDEELDDVPWRKAKSNSSKSNKFDSTTVVKAAYGKWLDSDENRSKEPAKQTSAMETAFQDELLDENYPNVKPSVVDKSSFGFSSRKPVKLFMDEKHKKSQQSSQQHVFALDDSPERSPVAHGRLLDNDVIIVPEDLLNDTKNPSMVPKPSASASKPSENQRIPVLGARVNQSKMAKQPSNSTLFLPPVSTPGSTLFPSQNYCPPSNFVDAYSSDHNNVHSFGPPSIEPSAEFFIGAQSATPVQPIGMPSFNHFRSVPPPTRWIPSTNPTLPNPLQLAVVPPPQYPAPTNLQTRTELSAAKSTATTTTTDAVKEEMQQQNRNLLAQKQEYVERLQLLTDEMAKLKGKKKELLEGRKTPETEQFLKENNKFQTEIQNKITAVENVIDMLSNMIAKNGGDPKISSKTSDRKDSPNNRQDNNSHKLSSVKNKKGKRDRESRSRSHSRHQTRSRTRSPKSRARSRARQRTPSKSRSRSRSRRRSKSKVRRKSLSHSPRKHRSRRSRSQDRHGQRRHTPEKRSKSISARKIKGRESSSPMAPSKKSTTAAPTNAESTVEKRRAPPVKAAKREESMKSAAECPKDRSKTSSEVARKKDDDGAKSVKAETIELENKTTSEAKPAKQINYVYYDPETHWCRVCNVFPQTAKEYLTHLHSVEHKTEMANCGMVDYPWHKAQPEVKNKIPADAPTERVPIRGLQFFVSATAWYCKLCNVFMGDLHCASVHLKSDQHQHNLSEFLSERPSWEDEWLKNRTKAYEEYSRKLCDSQADVFTCALPPSREADPKVSAAPAAAQQPPHSSSVSKDVNLINGDSSSVDTNHARKDESKSKHSDRERSKSKGREKLRSRGRARSRSKSRNRERSRGRNRSKGRDRSRDGNRSRDREQQRARGRSRGRDRSRDSADQRERTKHDRVAASTAPPKHHEFDQSKNEPNHSRESNRKPNDNAAATKASVQASAKKTADDDRFVEEWIPAVSGTSKEKELADLRDKLRRRRDDEKREKEKEDEEAKNLKRQNDASSSSKVTSAMDEKRAKKGDGKSKKDQPSVKMQPIVIGKGARFPFIGKMPSRSSRKPDMNATTAKKVADATAAVPVVDKQPIKFEQPVERIEREPDACNMIVDMDVNDVEDVPIVTEIVDDIDVRKKDFDETLKILYPDEEPPPQQEGALPTQSAVENIDLLSIFTSSMLQTMKQLPNQKGSLDASAMVDLVTTMSKTLLSVGQNVQNGGQLRVTNRCAADESDTKSKRETDQATAKKRIETSRSDPGATEQRGSTKRKNAMSQKRRRSLRKVREKLQEQEKQLQEKIDETKKNLRVESMSTPSEMVVEPESIPMPALEMVMDNFVSLSEPKDDCDLMLLGIEEGDSAALKF